MLNALGYVMLSQRDYKYGQSWTSFSQFSEQMATTVSFNDDSEINNSYSLSST